MTNEERTLVAVGMAHLAWEEADTEEHARWVAMAERCTEGTQTAEDEAEIAEAHEDMSEYYEDEEWYVLG